MREVEATGELSRQISDNVRLLLGAGLCLVILE